MHTLDIVLSVFLAFGLFKGFRNGFFIELASLVSFVLGIYLSFKFSYLVQNYLQHHGFWSGRTLWIVSFIITFVLFLIAISFLAKALTRLVQFAFLGGFNSLFGALLGALRMCIFLAVLIGLAIKINKNIVPIKSQQESKLYQPILTISHWVVPFIEKEFEEIKKRV